MSGHKDQQIELLHAILATLQRIEARLQPVRITTTPGTWTNPGLYPGVTYTSKADSA